MIGILFIVYSVTEDFYVHYINFVPHKTELLQTDIMATGLPEGEYEVSVCVTGGEWITISKSCCYTKICMVISLLVRT